MYFFISYVEEGFVGLRDPRCHAAKPVVVFMT